VKNDPFETATGCLVACWWIYVLVMGIGMLFSVSSLAEFVMGVFVIWVLIALPAIIRGKW
jgi:succinate-acetate transporter protein